MKTVIQGEGPSIDWTKDHSANFALRVYNALRSFMCSALLKFPLHYHALLLFALHYNIFD